MRLSSALVSFLFFLINFLLPFVEGTSSGNGNSAVSFTLCDDFTWEQGRHFSLQVASKTDPNALTARFGQGDSLTKFLSRNIQQNDVSFVKYESDHEICFQSLVVDTTIIIDQPTFFKESCEKDGENTALCQEKESEVQPVSVCPEALTKLLQESGSLRSMPTEKPGPNDFTPPIYEITDDMAHASQEIAEGTAELFRKVVKSKVQKLNEAKRVQFSDIGRKLKTFNSFMGAFGSMFSIFSCITSIITTFLTPNPFDELANYLNSEFREIHRRLSHIHNDIADLKRVVQHESKMCGMAGKLEAIRYSLRRYERMVKKLSEDKVCGADNLYNRTEVGDFMEQYKEDRVDDSLLDLFGVEFGEVLEASSLLKAMMRAYCTTDPGKVQRFMEGIINYALAGSLSHFAYTSLRCHKEARQDCDEDQDEREEWNRKLYEFLKKANALKEASTNPGYGLQLDIQEDLDKLIYEEVKVANSRHQFNQLFNKVFDFIINKMNDINDWPEACMYNLNDKVELVELAELLHNATEYDSDLRPWYLDIWNTGYGLRTRFKLKEGNSELYTKRYLTNELDNQRNVHCLRPLRIHSSWEDDCSVFFHNKPDENDWIISVLFNPNSYKIKAENPDNDHVTPVVFINRLPIYVYYTTDDRIREKLGHRKYLKVVRAQFSGDRGEYSQAAFLDPRGFGNSGTYP